MNKRRETEPVIGGGSLDNARDEQGRTPQDNYAQAAGALIFLGLVLSLIAVCLCGFAIYRLIVTAL